MDKRNGLATKLISVVASVVLVVGLVPLPAFAEAGNAESNVTMPLTAGVPARDTPLVEVTSWKELKDDINGSNPLIQLGCDVVDTDNEGYIEVKRGTSAVLDLNGYTLNRNLFVTSSSGSVIKVCAGASLQIIDGSSSGTGKIVGGVAKQGGGVFVEEGGSLVLAGGTITGNRAFQQGGGIYAAGKVTMEGGAIAENLGPVAGGTLNGIPAAGGGVYVDKSGEFEFAGGVISKNEAEEDGGGIYVNGTLTTTNAGVEGGTVSGNTAGWTGGGIYVGDHGKIQLSGATITGNTARKTGGGLNVHLKKESGSIKNCTITDNAAESDGGGLRLLAIDDYKLTIEDTVINNNTSKGDGGGVYLDEGKIEMSGKCSVSGNTASKGGGGVKVYKGSTFTATGATINNNTAKSEEGGGITGYGTMTLENCTISQNSSKEEGGGVYNDHNGSNTGKLTLKNCTITENTSKSHGGGVYSDRTLEVVGGSGGDNSKCQITNNTASGKGGGLFVGYDSDMASIQGTIIIRDNKGAFGKDVYLRKENKLTLAGSITGTNIGSIEMDNFGVFTNGYSNYESQRDPKVFFCTAQEAIPAVWTNDHKEAMLESEWPNMQTEIENAVKDNRPAVVAKDYTACSEDNPLKIEKGKSVTINLNGHTLNRNREDKADEGYVILVEENATLTIVDEKTEHAGEGPGTITGGWSKDGGGIYVGEGATLKFQGGTITGNKASNYGGGVYVSSGGTFRFEIDPKSGEAHTTGTISGNHSDGEGGGIFVNGGGTLFFDDGKIAKNTAGGNGGGVYVDGILKSSNTDVAGGTIEGNVASETGGGIYVSIFGTIQLSKATIADNTAVTCGGGLNALLKDSESRIDHCTITGNEAKEVGGGLCLDAKSWTTDSKTLKIEDTTIDNNTASAGGGIYLSAGNITMSGNSSISSNTAPGGGGGVYVTGVTTFEAYDLTINSNISSAGEGGGIENCGKTTLTRCTITRNNSKEEGGGIYNSDNALGFGHLTLEGCTIAGNTSGLFGGGVYSNKILTIRDTAIGEHVSADGTTIPGNKAFEKGGGVFIGNDSKNTEIAGSLSVEGNTAGDFGDNIYLRSGKLKCTGQLTGTGKIGVDLEAGTGVITKDFTTQHNKDAQVFVTAKGYDVDVNKDGEVEISSGWASMRKDIEGWSDGDKPYTLSRDYAAKPSDKRIAIQSGKNITVDLNGHMLNRNCDGKTGSGHTFEVFDGATLTIVDRSSGNSGMITGGWSGYGGGIYVHEGGTLNFEGGTICGNKATDGGGGIYVAGTLNMKADSKSPNKNGGVVESNKTQATGGGICLAGRGVLNFEVGTVTKNAADERGGGIMAEKGTTISVKGSPVVKGNDASLGGNDIFLPLYNTITVSGTLDEGAHVSAALESDWGVFTSGYESENKGKDPAAFFVSSEGYSVVKQDGEAAFDKDKFGETDYEHAFIYWSSQMNADEDTLNGHNWMSGISGERYLNEINMPGSHDAGMKNVIPLGWCEDNTATWTFWAPDIGAYFATTQVEYINQQLNEGARQLDLRLNNSKKVKDFGEYHWWDDGKNLWINHGTDSAAGTYTASGPDDELLSFDLVLIWVKDFLRKHPTETVILNIRPETSVPGQGDAIQARAKAILEASLLETNPSTEEAYLYKEPGSDDYFAPYTHIPQLKDCRGKAVLLPGSDAFVKVVGGFTAKSMTDYTDPTNYDSTATEQINTVEREYVRLNPGLDSSSLATDANQMLDANNKAFLWYWELNCTGEDQGTWNYIGGLLKAFKWTEKLEKWLLGSTQLGDNPIKLAERVNPALIGNGNLLGSNLTGQYIGWVRLDNFTAEYAEPIWRTNYFDDLQYCTVTVESALDDSNYPAQTYRLLKGTTITLPGNIYKNLPTGKNFDCWKVTTGGHAGKSYHKKDTYKIDDDVTFTAQWKVPTPVEIVWRDGENVDKLRPQSVDFSVTTRDDDDSTTSTTTVTLTDEKGWMGEVDGDIVSIDPKWERITNGEYSSNKKYEQGSGFIFTFVHTPEKTISTAGEVEWLDDDNAERLRPTEVTIHLVADGKEAASKTVKAADEWQFDFGRKRQYDSGRPIDYTIYEERDGEWAQAYSTIVDGFLVLNTHTPSGKGTMEVKGAIGWDDAENARLTRPEWVKVILWAGDKEVDSQKVKAGADGYWKFDFGEVPVNDSAGRPIEYRITEAEVPGYGEPFVTPKVASQGNCTFVVYNTLIVPDGDKDPSSIVKDPTPKSLTYNGEEQVLVKRGYCSGGTMMYALGADDSTAPKAEDFSPALPDGMDAGTDYVWYKVEGDAFHTDTKPACVTPTIAARPVTFTGVSESKEYAGSEIEIADAEAKGLVSGHVHNVASSAKGTDVGEYEGTITTANDVVIKSGVGEGAADVTANYKITTTPGTLTIEPVRATVTAKDQTLTYNGELQGPGDAAYKDPAEIAKMITVEGLRGSDTIANVTIDGQGKEAGEYQLTPSAAASSRASDGKDNYTFEYVTGTLTIEPKAATITTSSASKVYDGKPLTNDEASIDGLANGETATVTATGSQTEVGSSPNTYTIEWGTADAKNYTVTEKLGMLTVISPDEPAYVVASGEGSAYTEGSDAPLTFTFERTIDPETAFEHFTGIEVDGKAVPQEDASGSANWTARSGSVIVSLQPNYLKTLSEGAHTITALFDDGAPATADFSVSAPAPVATHTVTFDANGHGKAPDAQQVEDGKKAKRPASPTASGYTFGGWYTDKACKEAYDFSTPVTSDITLYAKWAKGSSSGGSGTSGKTANTGDPMGGFFIIALVLATLSALVLALSRRRRHG